MSTHSSGNALETKVRELHVNEDVSIRPSVEIPFFYTKTGKVKTYQPDLITADRVIECKNAENVGVVEKLPQAVLKQKVLAEVLNKTPFLIYEGDRYDWYIKNDPIMRQIMGQNPDVIVISFNNYKKHYS